MAISPTSDKTEERPRTVEYQPSFDGVRAIGITSFVLGHAGLLMGQPQLVPLGWWMYVDLFFVMSGYLITSLLINEQARNGRISLKAFYVRRVSRLYPLVILVLIIASIQRLTIPHSITTPSWSSIFSIAFYYSNFQQLTHHADMYSAWGPLWSLAIEEQFYLVWPIALVFLLGRSTRLGRPIAVGTIGIIGIWILRSYSWWTLPSDGNRLVIVTDAWHTFYYSSFHRPDGLLVGCVAALILALPRTIWIQRFVRAAHHLRFVTIPGSITIIVVASNGNAAWQVYWGLALFNILNAMILIELMEYNDSLLAKVLSWRPLLWLGRRSYFVYIMHLGIFMLLINVLGRSSLPWIFGAVVLLGALAGLSYRYYEDPLRRIGYRISRVITGSGLR